jgi:hypothetical protein
MDVSGSDKVPFTRFAAAFPTHRANGRGAMLIGRDQNYVMVARLGGY